MNLLDTAIIIGLSFLIVRGIFRGFFREIGSLAGLILGIWLANVYQPKMTEYLKSYLPSLGLLPLISFALIFIIVLVLCNLAGWGLKIMVSKAFLGWADRALGAALAVLKGLIATYLVIVLLTFFVPSKTPLIAKSRLAPIVITSYQSMVSLISPDSYLNWKQKLLGGQKRDDKAVTENLKGTDKKDGSN